MMMNKMREIYGVVNIMQEVYKLTYFTNTNSK